MNKREDGKYPYWLMGKEARKICQHCRFVAKNILKCGRCGHDMIVMDNWNRARPPRKNASKKKWKDFSKRFGLNLTV